MSNYQSPFREMVSVPSQMNTNPFGASSSNNSVNSNHHPSYSGSQSPFSFNSTSNHQQQAALALINRFSQSNSSNGGVIGLGGNGQKMYNDFYAPNYSNYGGHHPNSTTPLGFNENEFPSLSARPSSVMVNRASAGFGNMQQRSVANSFGGSRGTIGSGRSPYANLMKQPMDSQPEFQIHNEDFPALPGSQDVVTAKNGSAPSSLAGDDFSMKDLRFPGDTRQQQQFQQHDQQLTQQVASKRGIQTHPDGIVTGIPPKMLNDQFGMVGLLAFLRAVETEPSIFQLALGHDLTQLGLNLNSPEKNLYQSFGGPWSDVPCRAQDMDCHVPSEYMTNAILTDRLAPIKLNRYGEDLLFYLFYNFGGEMFQLAAAAELYNRDWRYHKEEKVWIARAPGVELTEKAQTYARGTFFVFDPGNWRKVQREMHLEYSKLEDRPMIPPQPSHPIMHPSQSVSGLPNIGLSSNAMHNS